MPIPVGSTAFPPPLPRTPNKVANVTYTSIPVPGDILIVGASTMQANTPVITLNLAKLDPSQFTVDMGVSPPLVKVVALPQDTAWIPYTPTFSAVTNGTLTFTNAAGFYQQNGHSVKIRLKFSVTVVAGSGPSLPGQDSNSSFKISLPVAPAGAQAQILHGWRSRNVAFPPDPNGDSFPRIGAIYVLPGGSFAIIVYCKFDTAEVGSPAGEIYLQGVYEV